MCVYISTICMLPSMHDDAAMCRVHTCRVIEARQLQQHWLLVSQKVYSPINAHCTGYVHMAVSK